MSKPFIQGVNIALHEFWTSRAVYSGNLTNSRGKYICREIEVKSSENGDAAASAS